jgi:hypothetical protein
MGVVLNSTDQGLNANPDVEGVTSFTFDVGVGTASVDFATGSRALFSLQGGCPVMRDYDGLSSSGSAVDVYRYKDPVSGSLGDAAVVMNSDAAGNWNTIMQSHAWFDIRGSFGAAPATPEPEEDLLLQILGAVLPLECQEGLDPTDVERRADSIDTPRQTALHQNVPNPFNPTTTIAFDLARDGHVRIKIFDVAGRLVRTLVDEELAAAFNRKVVWNGLGDTGERVSSGVYFYRLEADLFSSTRKMVVMR